MTELLSFGSLQGWYRYFCNGGGWGWYRYFWLDFVDDGDDDGGVAGGVVEDMADVFFDFVFESLELGVAIDGFVGFGAEIMTDFADEFFAIVEIDKGAGNDIGGLDEAAGFFAHGEDDDEDALA